MLTDEDINDLCTRNNGFDLVADRLAISATELKSMARDEGLLECDTCGVWFLDEVGCPACFIT